MGLGYSSVYLPSTHKILSLIPRTLRRQDPKITFILAVETLRRSRTPAVQRHKIPSYQAAFFPIAEFFSIQSHRVHTTRSIKMYTSRGTRLFAQSTGIRCPKVPLSYTRQGRAWLGSSGEGLSGESTLA